MEFDFLVSMLSESLCNCDQGKMIEEKKQETIIVNNGPGTERHKLYRIGSNVTGGHMLPFFNLTDTSPKNLQAFCDYILLVEFQSHTHIILIELKTGKASHAKHQLNASNDFVDYVIARANKIKAENNITFDNRKLKLNRVTIKPAPYKSLTRVDKNSNFNISFDDIYEYVTNVFNINLVCRHSRKYCI